MTAQPTVTITGTFLMNGVAVPFTGTFVMPTAQVSFVTADSKSTTDTTQAQVTP